MSLRDEEGRFRKPYTSDPASLPRSSDELFDPAAREARAAAERDAAERPQRELEQAQADWRTARDTLAAARGSTELPGAPAPPAQPESPPVEPLPGSGFGGGSAGTTVGGGRQPAPEDPNDQIRRAYQNLKDGGGTSGESGIGGTMSRADLVALANRRLGGQQ